MVVVVVLGDAARFVAADFDDVFFADALRFTAVADFADFADLADFDERASAGLRLLDADFLVRDFAPVRALADLPPDFLRDFLARAAMVLLLVVVITAQDDSRNWTRS